MAGQDDLSVHFPLGSYGNNEFHGQERNEELETEVNVLQKMMDHDQMMMHKYRDRLLHRQDDSALSIPNSLPPKMRELLAELAMVEKEINRLESQINELRAESKREKQVHMEANSSEWERETLRNRLESSPPLPSIPHTISKSPNEKVPFEIKALHFISKAIRGDYKLSDFSSNDKAINSRRFSNQNENAFHDKRVTFQEKIFKQNGMLKHPSPVRSRHQTPKRDRVLEREEESINKWPPNKLSENTMKCLIFIFVRLLRMSKAMELEKSGLIARSTNFSVSFRAETSSNLKSGLEFYKDLKQQDPYGIFESKESILRDIGPYKNLIRFTSSSMDFKCFQNSGFVPLFQKLKNLMDGLQKVDLRFLSHKQKLAFWINIYNACVMHGYLQYGVPSVSTPENMLTLINQATLNIAGHSINAQTIECFILRKPADLLNRSQIFGAREMMIHELYGLKTPDPNITFALCCGTRSSPAVKIYTADGVTAELERSKLEYLQAAIMVTSTKRIGIPELLLKNMPDFGEDVGLLMEWLCHELPSSGALRKSIVDCFRGFHGGRALAGGGGGAAVEKIPYDFEFQYFFAI